MLFPKHFYLLYLLNIKQPIFFAGIMSINEALAKVIIKNERMA